MHLLAPLALALLLACPKTVDATFRQRLGPCAGGFKAELGGKTICVENAWACGRSGVACAAKPADAFCPKRFSWFEKDDAEGCVPQNGDDDDAEEVDCLEGFEWKHDRCVPYTPPSGAHCDLAHNWWWGGGKKCGVPNACVPHNEPSNPPSPPGDDCCPDGWKYKRIGRHRTCVPPKPDWPDCFGKPKCPTSHKWTAHKGRCTKKHTRGDRGAGGRGGRGRRATLDYFAAAAAAVAGGGHRYPQHVAVGEADASLCPAGLTSCPIAAAGGELVADAWECLDTLGSELESCGGCTSLGQGQDCTAIAGAASVGCEAGACKVYSCARGLLSNNSCIE